MVIPRFWAANGRPYGYTFANGSENAIFTFIFHSPLLHEKKDFPQEVLFLQHGFTQYRPG